MYNPRLKQLLEYLDQGSTDPFIRYAIATEYVKQGALETALNHFNILRTAHGDYLGTYYQVGKLLEEMDRKQDAMEAYQQGISLAQKQGNLKTLAELRGALQNLLLEED